MIKILIVLLAIFSLTLVDTAVAKDTHGANGQPIREYETEFVNGQKVIKERISGGEWRVISSTPTGGGAVAPAAAGGAVAPSVAPPRESPDASQPTAQSTSNENETGQGSGPSLAALDGRALNKNIGFGIMGALALVVVIVIGTFKKYVLR
ncbi:MAG: hypothetical protein WC798_02250 [Candidatus Paceibacterota bacterium]|jgi:hypothetical protein